MKALFLGLLLSFLLHLKFRLALVLLLLRCDSCLNVLNFFKHVFHSNLLFNHVRILIRVQILIEGNSLTLCLCNCCILVLVFTNGKSINNINVLLFILVLVRNSVQVLVVICIINVVVVIHSDCGDYKLQAMVEEAVRNIYAAGLTPAFLYNWYNTGSGAIVGNGYIGARGRYNRLFFDRRRL